MQISWYALNMLKRSEMFTNIRRLIVLANREGLKYLYSCTCSGLGEGVHSYILTFDINIY